MFGMKKKILGLDIGTRSVKGVLLSRKGEQVALENYFYIDLPETLGEPGAGSEHVGRVVADLVEGAGLRNALVASAIDDREVQVVNISLPGLPDGELRLAVLNELEAQLGLEVKEHSVDFTVTPVKGEQTRSGQLEVHAFYTKMDSVKERLELLESAQLCPHSVEGAMHAALEAARFNEYLSEEETCLLVDAGDSHTSVGLVSRGELVQLNTIRAGAGEINQQLMQLLGCDFHNSELRKLAYHMEENPEAGEEGKAIEQGYYQIIVGIHDTATYFRASRKAQSIQRVILAGGGLMKEGAAALIEQSLGLPVTIADPLRKIEIFGGKEGDRERLPQIGPMLHVAVGLALRGVA